MLIKTVTEAKANLSRLIERVLAGEEVIIARAGTPVVVLQAYKEVRKARKPGALEGLIHIADDFDELPPDIAEAFGVDPS